jgi:hypothetical protein
MWLLLDSESLLSSSPMSSPSSVLVVVAKGSAISLVKRRLLRPRLIGVTTSLSASSNLFVFTD